MKNGKSKESCCICLIASSFAKHQIRLRNNQISVQNSNIRLLANFVRICFRQIVSCAMNSSGTVFDRKSYFACALKSNTRWIFFCDQLEYLKLNQSINEISWDGRIHKYSTKLYSNHAQILVIHGKDVILFIGSKWGKKEKNNKSKMVYCVNVIHQ